MWRQWEVAENSWEFRKKNHTQYAIKFLSLKLDIDSFFSFLIVFIFTFVNYVLIKIEFRLRFRQTCSIFLYSSHINGE